MKYTLLKCACGCGGEIEEFDSRGRKRKCIYGHHSRETKEKISKAGIGRHHSAETKKKISVKLKNKIVSEETRQKILD